MRCKLCGRHLYEHMSLAILFRWNYHIHPACEQSRLSFDQAAVFPLFDKMAVYDALFEAGSTSGDAAYLHAFHLRERYLEWANVQDRSIVVFIDDLDDVDDLRLLAPLAREQVILFSLWRMEIVSDEA